MKRIDSLQNTQLKAAIQLATKPAARQAQGLMVLEGFHLLTSYLQQQASVRQVFVHDRALAHPDLPALLAQLPAECAVFAVAEAAFAKLTQLTSPAEIIALVVPPRPLVYTTQSCVLLEDLQDPGNVGSILRTAAAAGIQQVFLSAKCADVWSPKVLRAGMGAHFALRLYPDADLAEVLRHFRGRTLVTSLVATHSLYATDLTGDCAFVFGNEGAGVSATLQALASDPIIIPMPGVAESLNVAAAVAVCLFERVRQCHAATMV